MTCSSQRSQHRPARHYAVIVKQQQQNAAPASDLAESCLRQETAAGDMKGSSRKLCPPAQKAMGSAQQLWDWQRTCLPFQSQTVSAKGSLHALANFPPNWWVGCRISPQRQQLYVHNGRHPHFPRAGALRKMQSNDSCEKQVDKCAGRKCICLLEKLCLWDKVILKRYTLIYKDAQPNLGVPCYTNVIKKTIMTHVINHKEQQSMGI